LEFRSNLNQKLLDGALFQANQAIVAAESPERSEMGTQTAVAVMFREQQPWVAHVGELSTASTLTSLSKMTKTIPWWLSAFKFGDITPEGSRTFIPATPFYRCLGRQCIPLMFKLWMQAIAAIVQ